LIFSTFKSAVRTPAGNAVKAALVGAKTVKGPAPERVAPSLAAVTAATKVLRFAAAANSGIVGAAKLGGTNTLSMM